MSGFILTGADEAVAQALRGAVIAIGNFDGVHRGHQQLIAQARDMARARGVPAAILTFSPHPRAFFAPDTPFFRITPQPERVRVMRRLGLDGVIIRRFDAALAATRAQDFLTRFILEEIGASGVVVGHDFHFGKGREGNPQILQAFCAAHDIACNVVPVVEETGGAISSSAIRAALTEGDIIAANRLLGYRWFVIAPIRHGEKRGRDLGYPTANMALREACALRHGIYAVRMAVNGALHNGVASFGRRPTFDDGAPLLETFLFDFSGDLYGAQADVEFLAFLRAETRFESAQALIAQMNDDSARARTVLAQSDTTPSMITPDPD
ncbi:bifunctional riboflavin kinase/FAD synthetase [Saliniramus sp.]|uniref:bifunctional riboflavin kinase/FAD synthetase n=1 Tax=Saliniramus sp. TaxID=2986772 RepID=UPI002B6A30A6|nr:bifunctional riboflavin kinase/FAD synthetase [Saliniramus sp.]HMB10304.1 bifunctional riboflavin kinase/FAD synthetase [Saliniramus sp.]